MRSRPGYARILVEVDTNKELVKEVVFKLPNGDVIHQQVVFEHPPILCKSCKRIGHSEANCKKDERLEIKGPVANRPDGKSGRQGRSRSRRPGKEAMEKPVPQGKTIVEVRPMNMEKGENSKTNGTTSNRDRGAAKEKSVGNEKSGDNEKSVAKEGSGVNVNSGTAVMTSTPGIQKRSGMDTYAEK